jgi:hypothetical protein
MGTNIVVISDGEEELGGGAARAVVARQDQSADADERSGNLVLHGF